jgi:hypothetical protein
MQKSYKVPKMGRIQIAIASGHDESVVAAALKLSPIKVEIIRQTFDGFELLLSYPRGIKISILENTEEHQPYYADTTSEVYKLLFVPRKEGQGIVFSSGGKHLADELLLTRKYPLIVEPVINEVKAKHRFQLLVACYKGIEILRSEAVDRIAAYDPFSIPTEMMNTLSILKEDIPKEVDKAKLLSKRIENIRELFKWYAKRLLAEKTSESLQVYLTQLNDMQIKVDHLLLSGDRQENHAPISTMSESSFIDGFKEIDGFNEVKAALMMKNWEEIPMHECGSCGGNARTVNRKVEGEGGNKEIWFVECTNCKSRSARHDWGVRSQTIASWNKLNGQYKAGIFPECFAFDGLRDDVIFKNIKAINNLVTKMEEAIRILPVSMKESLSDKHKRLLEIKLWTAYIRTALKESRKTA